MTRYLAFGVVIALTALMGSSAVDVSAQSTPGVIISEVHSAGSGNGTYSADWFEVTNTGATAVDITGWKVDDSSNAFANAVELRGVTSIPAGRSDVFFENSVIGMSDFTVIANFSSAWFGRATPPGGFLIGAYGGSGVGLGTGGDAVNLSSRMTARELGKFTYTSSGCNRGATACVHSRLAEQKPHREDDMSNNRSINRRAFLTNSAAVAGGVAITTPFKALFANAQHSRDRDDRGGGRRDRGRRSCSPDYGPLSAVNDQTTGLPLLLLPEGFEYLTFGWTGDPMSDGTITPGSHDGMAAFQGRRGVIRLVRNHELDGPGTPFTGVAYDARARGGTTTLEFDTRDGTLVGSWPSLSGTVRNCAGGPTPWGSWLTCEETTSGPGAPPNGLAQPHGYIFEVPAFGSAYPTPFKAMGRFSHEAVAVDPDTGIIYETEDANPSGLYRFLPDRRGDLASGGTLQMLAIDGSPNYNTRVGQVPDEPLDVVWVPIGNPDPIAGQPSVYAQGALVGGAVFSRLEGAWWSHGKAYFVSTDGGNVNQGQIWEYEPCSETLSLVFESPAAEVLNAPDNICASPRGGFILCEDGSGMEFLHGLTVDGNIFRFAQNNVDLRGPNASHGFTSDFRGSEFAGATYSPDGRWLFVNVQSPGITFAITGPWRNGAL